MVTGAGFQDIETRRRLTSDYVNTMRYAAHDRRRANREQQQYEQKQAIDEQERRKERAGARLTGILASGLSTEEMYKQIQTLQEEFKNTDLAGTDAGRGMFGAYGMLGRRSGGVQQYSRDYYENLGLTPEQSQQALERKHLGAGDASDTTLEKDLKTLRNATEKDDAVSQKLIQDRLNKNPRYLEIQKNIEGGVWLSRMKGGESGEGGDFETLVKGKPEQRTKGRMGTFDDMYGGEAYKLALTEAIVEGGKLGLSPGQVTAGFNEWWDKERNKNTGRWRTYADRSTFSPQATATEAELQGGMSDMIATDTATAAARDASRQGQKITEAVNRGPRAPHPALNKVWATLNDEQKAQAARARSNGWTWKQIAEAISGGK